MRPLLERFMEKWEPVTESGCWLWTAATTAAGYGLIGRGRTSAGLVYAHRVSYEHHKGPIPEGLELDHLCRVRCCVNPDHLEAVTHQENIRRGRGGENNATKTHCQRGHEYSEENTYRIPSSGGRVCRICRLDRQRARRMEQA